MTEFNLPPGVTVNMIPGNRPEDEAEEKFWEELDAKFKKEHPAQFKLIEHLMFLHPDSVNETAIAAYVTMARDMGYAKGYDDARLTKKKGKRMSDETYSIVRFFYDPNKPREVIREGLTLKEAQEHCKDPGTKGHDWFDGYESE